MSNIPKSLELDRIGIERLKADRSVKDLLKRMVDKLEEIHRLTRDRLETLNPQDHIADADGTIGDITTKFNTLLSQLESQDLLDTS